MRQGVTKAIAMVALALLFMGAILSVHWPHAGQDSDPPSNDEVAKSMFGEGSSSGFALIMFLIGLLLLVALLGGVFLAKEEEKE